VKLERLLVLVAALMLVAFTALTVEAQEMERALIIIGKTIGAGIAVGFAGIGAGIAVGVAGAAAISAITERREMFGVALLIVVLGEGIAIYGLLIALLLILII
jgi:V/A-type H+-transporting ATPase subunit K